MSSFFGETLRRLRTEKGVSQQQLAELVFVDRSSIASWEIGRRMPDAAMICHLSQALGVDVSGLLKAAEARDEKPVVILLDDEELVLSGGLSVLRQTLPNAEITAFSKPSEALRFSKENKVALAFLDIELGKKSGIEVCRELLQINPHTNVIFLTAYMEYSYEAWDTGASGFMLKPISEEAVRRQLEKLRHPVSGLERV